MLLAQRLDGMHLRRPHRRQFEDQQIGHVESAGMERKAGRAFLQRHGLEIADHGAEPVDFG
ncbi:hypothetical protein D3C81_1102630 [compost metagenome]